MDRVLTCHSRADQSQNVFGNVFSDEIKSCSAREPIFIPLHRLLRRDLDRFDAPELSSGLKVRSGMTKRPFFYKKKTPPSPSGRRRL